MKENFIDGNISCPYSIKTESKGFYNALTDNILNSILHLLFSQTKEAVEYL